MMCHEARGMDKKRVEGRLWGDVCREQGNNFAKMCVYAWQRGWLSGGYANVVYKWVRPT